MSVDTLSPHSREFFERAKMKQTLSLTFAGIGLLFFGMTCEDGGRSNAATIMKDGSESGHDEDLYGSLSAGYGFSCFVKLLACVLAFSVSLYFSTFFCGSLNEKKAIRYLMEINEHGTPAITDEEVVQQMGGYQEPEVTTHEGGGNSEAASTSPIDKSGAV